MPQIGSTPEETLHQLTAELADRTRRYESRRDSRCVFTYCYFLMTAQLERGLAASGCRDHVWIADLAVEFSRRYFNALDRCDAPDPSRPLPESWRTVFDTAKQRYTSVAEDLVFGITAHIVADLPHALVAVGLTDGAGRSRIADYHAVNDILGNAIEPISRHVGRRYAYPLFALESLGGSHTVLLTSYGIRLARAAAWYNAVRLQDPDIAAIATKSIEDSAILIVKDIVNPPLLSLRMLLRVWRVLMSFLRRWPEPLEIDGSLT